MNILLSSFAFSLETEMHGEYFFRMPPISFQAGKYIFEPDYSVLFLGDKFIIDTVMVSNIFAKKEFFRYKELVEVLREDGRLIEIDFNLEIEPYRVNIKKFVGQELQDVGKYLTPFEELVEIWAKFDNFLRTSNNFKRHDRLIPYSDTFNGLHFFLSRVASGMMNGMDKFWLDNLKNWDKLNRYYKEVTIKKISIYIEHILSNICLADKFNAVIYDWEDISPIYKFHFDNSYRIISTNELAKQEKCKELFKIMFPDFYPDKMQKVIKILNDNRILELRSLINAASEANKPFDVRFVNDVLNTVIKREFKVKKYKNIAGWITKPLGFIPWSNEIAEIAIDATIEVIIEKQIPNNRSWFYLISENT